MNYRTTIEKISYQFSTDGALITFLRINPAIILAGETKCINKFPVNCFDPKSDFEVAQGDIIDLTIKGSKILLKILSRSSSPRKNIKSNVCPSCGQPLLTDGTLLYCLNKECHAQMIQNLLYLTSSLGLTFVGSNRRIFDMLVSSAAVTTPADLFEINLNKLYTNDEPQIHAQMFQQYLHSVRGHVSIDQILKGLKIFGISDETINQITTIFNTEKLTLLDVEKLFEDELFEKYPDIDWAPWKLFISMESNRNQLVRLCNILNL